MLLRRNTLLLVLVFVVLGVGFQLGRREIISRSIYKLNLGSRPTLGRMELPKRGEKVVIFAPHEDDETLGAGGYLQKAVAAGAKVHVILITNGEYPELSVILFEETLRLNPQKFIHLGYMRQKETLRAVKYLGLPPGDVTFLGYPNQYLDQMWLPDHWTDPVRSNRTRATRSPYNNSMTPRAIYCGRSVLRDVETVLSRERPDVVITLHPNDVHIDHWPTYAFVRYALDELAASGETFARDCRVYTYLIHRDSWPAPRGYHPKSSLEPPATLSGHGQADWRVLPLTRRETGRKHEAIRLYRTQLGPVDPLLQAFARKNELFAAIPQRDWPADWMGSFAAVIEDPQADLLSSAGDGRGDIRIVSITERNGRMRVTVTTRKTASRSTGYHLALHAGGAGPADRAVAEYDWRGSSVSARVLKHGKLGRVDPGAMETTLLGQVTTLEAPWPFMEKKPAFMLVRAWTTHGRRTVDETTTASFARPEITGLKGLRSPE